MLTMALGSMDASPASSNSTEATSSSEDEDAAAAAAAGGVNTAAGEDGGAHVLYNVEALHEQLEDFAWTDDADWEETFVVTSDTVVRVDDVDDDIERELAFYNQALSAAAVAIERCEERSIPWARPPDFYAEMVKTDDHMAKVKSQLMFEQQQIEQAEERRKQRVSRQYAKQVQAEKLKGRAQDKKAQIERISKLRKQRQRTGFSGDLDMDAELDKMSNRGIGGPNQRQHQLNRRDGKSKKRQMKDAKYGFGGPTRRRKSNDATSAADMEGYRPSKAQPKMRGKGFKNSQSGRKGSNVGKKKSHKKIRHKQH